MRAGALGLVLLALASCRDAEHVSGTAILIRVDLVAVNADQLRYTGTDAAQVVFGPEVRPSMPAGTLPGTTTVRVLLNDALAGHTLNIAVEALSAGAPVSQSSAIVGVELGVEREVTVVIGAASDGGACSGCAGCCSGASCLSPSAAACGLNGSPCVVCDAQVADNCGADGLCRCGVAASCSPIAGADTCSAGVCGCGSGPSCAAGLECLSRSCQCTAASCNGCCSGGACVATRSASACAPSGMACADCGIRADGCSAAGICECGGRTVCNTGERCEAGSCVCDACPGCCTSGNRCAAGTSKMTCGLDGGTCQSCGGGMQCNNGVCG
jgi:hypothetical protein